MITVYHADQNLEQGTDLYETYRDMICGIDLVENARKLLAAGAYARVAVITGDSLEQAFTITQSINTPWFEVAREELQIIGKPEKMHTRVGDLMMKGRLLYVVDRLGFEIMLAPTMLPTNA